MSSENSLPEEYREVIARLRAAVDTIPAEKLRAHVDKVSAEHKKTTDKVYEIEFLLGRQLTRGEINWLHRRLHHGLHMPGDAILDYEFEQLDAAYRERLARSDGGWRGPDDDISPDLLQALGE